jgi:DNA-binding PadR family transcriptional regulator
MGGYGVDGVAEFVWGHVVSQFLRGAVRLHILHHADIEPVHGAWMTEELAGHGYNISPGTLYPMLHRMQHDGLLTSRTEVVDGRARRVYAITDQGRAVLVEERTALAELAAEVLGRQEDS